MTDQYEDDNFDDDQEYEDAADASHRAKNKQRDNQARRRLDDYLYERSLKAQLEDVFQDYD